MHRASESVSHGLMDGYRAGSAVVRRSVGRIGVPGRICAIDCITLSVSIPLHLDDVFTVSLVLHSDKNKCSVRSFAGVVAFVFRRGR